MDYRNHSLCFEEEVKKQGHFRLIPECQYRQVQSQYYCQMAMSVWQLAQYGFWGTEREADSGCSSNFCLTTSFIFSISFYFPASRRVPSFNLVIFLGDSEIFSSRLLSLSDSVCSFFGLCIINLIFACIKNKLTVKMRGQLPTTTILADKGQEGLSASHPLFYTQERSKYLQRLAAKTEIESELPTNDLRRNLRVDHYLNEYNLRLKQHEKQLKIKNSMLKTNEFHSIFAEQEIDRRQEERGKREARKIQEDLFKNYVENPQIYTPAERDVFKGEDFKVQTVLEMGGNRQRQLYLLDLQIGRLRQEQQLDKKVKISHESCKNNELLGKLSSHLVSSYLVYFDEIFNLMMDELLEDEVIYLNHLQAEKKVGDRQREPPSRKTVQMAELVLALNELCQR